ncbi:MAG: hypothetical protein RLZZ251_605 [Actinomycetota bacterium]
MESSLSIALSNLTSVSVLVFVLGFISARFKSDIRIPDQVYQIISVYLLFGIGLKGGVALHHSGASGIIKPVIFCCPWSSAKIGESGSRCDCSPLWFDLISDLYRRSGLSREFQDFL